MAILDSLPGIEVMICVDDEPLREYEEPEDEIVLEEPSELDEESEVAKHQRSVTVKRLVESTAGKFYTIRCIIKDPYRFDGACTHLSLRANVDGTSLFIGSTISKEKFIKQGSKSLRMIEGSCCRVGEQDLLQRFRFAETRISPESTQSNSLHTREKIHSMGSIEVWVHRRMFLHKFSDHSSYGSLVPTAHIEVAESLLKGQAKSHNTAVEEAEAVSPKELLELACCDGAENHPIAIFKFQYGSKGDLKALGMIERTPEPEPEPNINLAPEIQAASTPQVNPEIEFKSDPEAVNEPKAEPPSPRMSSVERWIGQARSKGTPSSASTSGTMVDTFAPTPSRPFAIPETGSSQNITPSVHTGLIVSPHAVLPMNPSNLILQGLDPIQTGQLFGQFLQFLQTQQGQLVQVPAPPPTESTVAAASNPPASARDSRNGTATARDPPIKREREENESGSRKRRRKQAGKVTIDLTEHDSDDAIVIDRDSD